MFFIIRLLLLIVIVFFSAIRAMEKQNPIKTKPKPDIHNYTRPDIHNYTREDSTNSRGLLIFLNDSHANVKEPANDTIETITSNVFAAMSQKPNCPIIVTSWLLKIIFWAETQNKFDLYKKRQLNDPLLINFYNSNLAKKNVCLGKYTNEQIENDRFLYLKTSGINLDDWIIKEVRKDLLYLLISKNYLKDQFSLEPVEIDKKNNLNNTTVTTTELKIGLKVNHMETINNIDTITPPNSNYNKAYFTTYLIPQNNANNPLDDSRKGNFFCVLSDYLTYNATQTTTNAMITEPAWGIFMMGHGAYGKKIVSMSLISFRKFLDFLRTRFINTQLLVLFSCFAAGDNAKEIYKNDQSSMPQIYPFPIITNALTDAVTYGYNIRLESSNGSLKFETNAQFPQFVANLTTSTLYQKVWASIQSLFGRQLNTLQTIPQIKLPGFEYFFPYNRVISIGSILAKTMDKDKSLTIDTSNYAAVLIYAKEIPFELSITHQLNIDKSAKKAPLASHFQKAPLASHFLGFAFMSSGLTNRHKIKKISSNSYTYKDILRMLMAIRYLAVDKIINIETIIDQNKEELDNVIVTNTNIIENNEKRWRAWYKKTDKKLYLYEEFIEKEITPTDPLYEEYLKQSSSLNVSENPNLNSPENINQNQINNLNEVIIKRIEKEYSTALDIFHTDKVPARKIQNQCQPSDTKTRARLLNIAVTKTHLDDSSMEDIVSDLVTNENIVNLNLFPLHPRCVLESAIAYGTTTTAELLVEKYYAQVLSDKNEILMKALDAGLGYNKIKFILKTLKTTPSNEVLKTAYSKSPHDVLYLFAEYVKFETEEVATDCLVKAIDNPNISLPSLEQICFYMQNIKPQVTQNLINNINPKNHALKEFLEKKLNIISE